MKYQPPVGGSDDASYVDANPSTGVEGSPVPAAAIEYPMREIINVIEAAGLTPSNEELDQLKTAILAIINANMPSNLGTAAGYNVGSENGELPTNAIVSADLATKLDKAMVRNMITTADISSVDANNIYWFFNTTSQGARTLTISDADLEVGEKIIISRYNTGAATLVLNDVNALLNGVYYAAGSSISLEKYESFEVVKYHTSNVCIIGQRRPATQVEADAGTDDVFPITSLKLSQILSDLPKYDGVAPVTDKVKATTYIAETVGILVITVANYNGAATIKIGATEASITVATVQATGYVYNQAAAALVPKGYRYQVDYSGTVNIVWQPLN
ncbi:MAG: hypothetical protein AB7U85_04975 [Alphaproteobacteria bacterium]